jgi:hypothetical protein
MRRPPCHSCFTKQTKPELSHAQSEFRSQATLLTQAECVFFRWIRKNTSLCGGSGRIHRWGKSVVTQSLRTALFCSVRSSCVMRESARARSCSVSIPRTSLVFFEPFSTRDTSFSWKGLRGSSPTKGFKTRNCGQFAPGALCLSPVIESKTSR